MVGKRKDAGAMPWPARMVIELIRLIIVVLTGSGLS